MKRALFVCALLLVWNSFAHAQWDTSPGAQTGIKSNGSYFSGEIDAIGLFNGNLTINIPLFSLPGRELSRGLSAVYNSQKWEPNPSNSNILAYTGGWQVARTAGFFYFDDQLVDCEEDIGYWQINAIWVDGTGGRHLYSVDPNDSDQLFEGGCNQEEMPAATLYSVDPDGSVLTLGFMGYNNSLKLRDGTLIEPGIMTTRNGNYLGDLGTPGYPMGTFGDTVGRSVSAAYTSTSGTTYFISYTITDIDGDPKIYKFNYEDDHAIFTPGASNWGELNGWLMSIDLPNGKSYTFEYAHDQGFLTKVTFPTGAYIRYVYAGCSGSGTCTNHTLADDQIIKRIVSADGTSGAEKTWEYTRNEYNSLVTVTNPDGTLVEHDFDNTSGLETEIRWKEGSTVVQTVQTSWYGNPSRPYETTTIVGSLKRKTTLSYDGEYRVTRKDDSDWYTGSTATPLARTDTAYTTLTGGLGVVDSVTTSVWDGSDYVVQGKTEYDHDETAYSNASVSGTVPHHVTPTGDRGNVTTVRHYKDASTYVTEHFYYDVLGNMIRHDDALDNPTYTSYADNFSDSGDNGATYAFPTLITNAEGHTSAFEYDFNTGLVTEITDVRGQTAEPTYDFMNRPLTVPTPGGGQTEYEYDDDALTVEEKVLVATGKYRITTTTMDGLYRPIQTVLTDPAGDVHVLTEYDGNGRAYRVSQPYRPGSPVWTQTAFDALSRPITITNPDSTTVQLAYSGNTVIQTDESGVQRQQTFDGLGRLTKVAVPDPAHTTPSLTNPLTTAYEYTLSGLKKVIQYLETANPHTAQERTFTRDWLGRLLQETHPETGTGTYTYDAAGQLATRTDARGSGYTATYTYDDIGRPLTITYADDTPDITYAYDELDSVDYIGLLTSVTVGDTDPDTTTYTYTAAGQVASENREFDGVTGTFTSSYTYDLGGRMLTATYPSERVVTYSYQSDGEEASDRINTIVDGPTTKTLISSVTDNAAGMVTSRTLGTTTGTVIAQEYNTRNQLTGIAATQSSSTLLDLDYGYTGSSLANVGRIRSRTDAVEPHHSVSYTYDAMYRLKQVSRTATDTPAWSIAWTFDQWGNRTLQTASGLSEVASQELGYSGNNRRSEFDYDSAGNLTNDDVLNYYWDAESRLKQSGQIGGGTVTYAYDGDGRRVKKTTSAGTTYYMYGITGLQSEFSTVNTGITSVTSTTNRLTFRVPEQTGTGVLLLDEAGAVVENNRVLPYGELFKAISGSTNDDKFTTYNRDPETGNDYAMARYYAKQYGAFLSPDPGHVGASLGDPLSWNAYIYTADDPVNFVDPSGTDYQICPQGVCGGRLSDSDYYHEYVRVIGTMEPQLPDPGFIVDQDIKCEGVPCGFVKRLDPQNKDQARFGDSVTKARGTAIKKLMRPSDGCTTMFQVGIMQSVASFVGKLRSPSLMFQDGTASKVDLGGNQTVQDLFKSDKDRNGENISDLGIFLRPSKVSPALVSHETMHEFVRSDTTILGRFKTKGYLVKNSFEMMVPIDVNGITAQIEEVLKSECGL